MQDKKELVEQALNVIAPEDVEYVGSLQDFAERIVEAGWIPPAQQSEVAARAVDRVSESLKNADWYDDELQEFLTDYANQLRKGEGDE